MERHPVRLILQNLQRQRRCQATHAGYRAQLVGDQLLVRTSDSVVEITEVTPSGKKRMAGADFARGARLDSGSKFE